MAEDVAVLPLLQIVGQSSMLAIALRVPNNMTAPTARPRATRMMVRLHDRANLEQPLGGRRSVDP